MQVGVIAGAGILVASSANGGEPASAGAVPGRANGATTPERPGNGRAAASEADRMGPVSPSPDAESTEAAAREAETREALAEPVQTPYQVQYGFDDETGRRILEIVGRESGDVIAEMPPKAVRAYIRDLLSEETDARALGAQEAGAEKGAIPLASATDGAAVNRSV